MIDKKCKMYCTSMYNKFFRNGGENSQISEDLIVMIVRMKSIDVKYPEFTIHFR